MGETCCEAQSRAQEGGFNPLFVLSHRYKLSCRGLFGSIGASLGCSPCTTQPWAEGFALAVSSSSTHTEGLLQGFWSPLLTMTDEADVALIKAEIPRCEHGDTTSLLSSTALDSPGYVRDEI